MNLISTIKALPKVLRHSGNKALFALKKASPQLLVGTGAVVMTGAFVLAIVNARKMDQTMTESQEKVDDIQAKIAEANEESTDIIVSEEDKTKLIKSLNKDLRAAKVEGIQKMFFLMGIPCLMFAGGMCLIIGGHRILFKRFGQVSTAFAALQESYNRYRQLNIAEHGEECDKRYIHNVVGETEMETTYTDENGEEKTAICKVPIVDGKRTSMYSFEFSERTSPRCPKSPINMISYLKSQEQYWNVWMNATGRPVTLYMVLNDLGIHLDPDDPANDYVVIAGWRPNGDGDNYIDFGIMRAVNKPAIDMLVNSCMLEFNCDGNIYKSSRYSKDGKKIC